MRALRVVVLPFALLAAPTAAQAPAEPAPAAPQPPAPQPAAPAPRMERHSLVILRRGPAWTPEVTDETKRIQAEHLAHLTRLGEQGKILVAGPFGDQEDATARGLCLYATPVEEARALASDDPAVKAGRLRVEVMSWWVERGYMTFPRAPAPPASPSP